MKKQLNTEFNNFARRILYIFLGLGLAISACNPFAPAVDNTLIDRNALLGDRHSVKGLFDYFRNTYELRDSLLYGRMLARDFRFQSYDYTNSNSLFLDRDQDMLYTYKLFTEPSVKSISLLWASYYNADTAINDTLARVERNFNLTVVQGEQSITRATGRANLTLARPDKFSEWKIKYWVDNSDR